MSVEDASAAHTCDIYTVGRPVRLFERGTYSRVGLRDRYCRSSYPHHNIVSWVCQAIVCTIPATQGHRWCWLRQKTRETD